MQLRKNNPVAGISWFVLHCFLFALISVVTKTLQQSGLHIFEIVFFQTFIGVFILLPQIILRHLPEIGSISYKTNILRALAWVIATILFFQATNTIDMGRAIAISFAVPLFTSVLAVIFLKEQLHLRRIIALILGFIGMLIIIRPGLESFEPESLLVVAAAFLWSTTDVMIKMASKRHHAVVNTFYFSIFAAGCTLPIALFAWQNPTAIEWLWLVLLALLFIANMFSITKAYENADLTIVMPFVFSELIFVAALAYIMFGETIQISTAIGSAVIIVSASYIAYREKIERGKLASQELAKELAERLS